jgi:hypothetical protein
VALSNGRNLFVTFNQAVEQAGHGYVEYLWPKPKAGGGVTDELYLKLSYVKKIRRPGAGSSGPASTSTTWTTEFREPDSPSSASIALAMHGGPRSWRPRRIATRHRCASSAASPN